MRNCIYQVRTVSFREGKNQEMFWFRNLPKTYFVLENPGFLYTRKKKEVKLMHAWMVYPVKIEHTVDGQNPAPPIMMIIPLFIGF